MLNENMINSKKYKTDSSSEALNCPISNAG